jgi:hypothetical protein
MSATDSDVIVTQYRAEFRADPFCRPEWQISGGWEYRETLARRRSRTVARDIVASHDHVSDVTGRFVARYKGLTLPGSIDVFAYVVPDRPGSRYGVAIVLEQRRRTIAMPEVSTP